MGVQQKYVSGYVELRQYIILQIRKDRRKIRSLGDSLSN